MIEKEAEKWPGEDSEPPEGDVSWLWYRPGSGVNASLTPSFNSPCLKCDIFVVAKPYDPPPRCWVCGQFLRRVNTGWNPHNFRNSAPVNQPPLDGT